MTKEKVKSQKAELKKVTVSTLVSVGIGFLFLVLTIGANTRTASSMEKENKIALYTNQYRMASKELTYNVQAFAVTAQEENYEAYIQEVNEDHTREKATEELDKLGLSENEWSMINQVAELSNGLVPLELEAFEAGKKGDMQSAQSLVFGEKYETTMNEINAISDQLIEEMGIRLGKISSRLRVQSIIFEGLVVLAFLAVVWQILKTVKFARDQLLKPIMVVEEQMSEIAEGNLHAAFDMQPDESEVGKMVAAIRKMKNSMEKMIGEISEILNQMAQGNFLVEVRQEYVGDFVVIKDSLNKIIGDMNDTLGTISGVSGQINRGAEQLAHASQEIAQSSTSQASAVEELAATMAELSENMQHSAQESKSCVEIAAGAAGALVEGNGKMEELERAISNISQCSEKIGTIIETINDIASQTNLLSLNAAIEAARAGEAGKGFAVVAEQVKNLAGESSKAAGETTALIQETVNAVDIGIELTAETKKSMDQVMQGAKAATEKMNQVSEKLNQDVASMDQVSQAINQVAEVIESNTAASEETAAVSQQQREEGESMAELVGNFRIRT